MHGPPSSVKGHVDRTLYNLNLLSCRSLRNRFLCRPWLVVSIFCMSDLVEIPSLTSGAWEKLHAACEAAMEAC